MGGRDGWMMGRMLGPLPRPLLPAGSAEIAPGVGLVTGADGGGLVIVHGLATFAWDGGDEAGRRLAAVQLVRLRAAARGQVAEAFGVDPATIWRWDRALSAGGVAGLVPARRGPKGASKLTAGTVTRIRELDAAGKSLREIAAATGVSTFSVRNALGRVAAQPAADGAAGRPGRSGEGGGGRGSGGGGVAGGGGRAGPARAGAPAGRAGAGAGGVAVGGRTAAAGQDALGFLHVDGHARAYHGPRDVQKTHVARLKFPAPATMETWVTDQHGDPVFMVVAEPSESLAGELKRLLPDLRAIVGEGRRGPGCLHPRGPAPAPFPHIPHGRVAP